MYQYKEMRASVLTDEGQNMVFELLRSMRLLCAASGVVTGWAAMRGLTGDSWKMLAALDYLIEKKQIREVVLREPVCGQDRVFAMSEGA